MEIGALGILPLVLCIGVAIVTRKVLLALAASVWLGATLMQGMNPLLGMSHALSELLIKRSLANASNMGIILFCLTMGALVGITTALGGINALTGHVLKRARGRRATQLSAGVLGLVLFVDDYASSMVVGNSLGKVVDVRRVSREKLAYIADATAAAASSLIPASTWTAMQLALIASNWPGENSLVVFIRSIPYQFYSIFCIVLVFVIAWWDRDFGPMLAAERRAVQGHAQSAPEADLEQVDSGSLAGFFVPFGTFLFTTLVGLWRTGYRSEASVIDCIANGDPSQALLWGAVAGCMSGLVLGVLVQKRKFEELSTAAQKGVALMFFPAMVLGLSFALKASLSELKLDAWLVESTRAWLHGHLIPVPTFLLAALCAWSTGTSWGTNALLIPLAVPLALSAGGESTAIVTLAAVFSGAIFGDHCSPISDTTIVSAAACKTDTFDHFRTQMPYGLLGGGVSLVLGILPASLGVSSELCLAMGLVALILTVRVLGKVPHQQEELQPEQLPVQETGS